MMKAAHIIAAVALFALGLFFGVKCRPACPEVPPPRVDTLTVYDTIRLPPPPPVVKYLVRTETASLPLVRDTVYVEVEVPIERKVYETEDYRAEIEGFRPELVSLDIYRRTQLVTQTQTVTVSDNKRWSIGPYVGYGVTAQNGRLVGVPVVGVGVQYSLIKW